MRDTYFRFKRFMLAHDRCAMKIGTDGVLLGAWAHQEAPGNILDIGTGSGLIALMLAQRFGEAMITAIEPDGQAAAQAEENFGISEWKDRLSICRASLQEFAPATEMRFDMIVSNPPFYDTTLINPDPRATSARHTCSLSHGELMQHASRLLDGNGSLSIIIPDEYSGKIIRTAAESGLHPVRKTSVLTVEGKRPRRVLAEFSKHAESPCAEETLVIRHADGSYTEEYKRLTADFYLAF